MNVTGHEPYMQLSNEAILVDRIWEVLGSILTFVANGCVLVIEGRLWYRRKTINQPKQLVLFLTTVDFFCTTLGVVPEWCVLLYQPCNKKAYLITFLFSRFCLNWLITLSKCVVVLMAMERMLAIQTPFYYVRRCTIRALFIAETIFTVYALSIAAISLTVDIEYLDEFLRHSSFQQPCFELFVQFEYPFHVELLSSGHWLYPTSIIISEVQDFILTIVLIVCNIVVILGLRKMNRRMKTLCPRPKGCRSPDDVSSGGGQEFSRFMIAIGLTDIALTLPNLVRVLQNHVGHNPSTLADVIARRLNISISFVNPLLYSLMRKELRQSLCQQIPQACRCCRKMNTVAPLNHIDYDNHRIPRQSTHGQTGQ